jgi:hypothetical protein
MVSIMDRTQNKIHTMSNDRVLVLAPMEGMSTKSSSGLTDNRLFTGDNRIHAIRDPQSTFWYVKYDQGIVPPPLQQRFTTWQKMYDYVREYFKRRNILIKEIIDLDG